MKITKLKEYFISNATRIFIAYTRMQPN